LKDGRDERGVLREALAVFLRTHGFARTSAARQLKLQQLREQLGSRRRWQAAQLVLDPGSLACLPGRLEALKGRLYLPGQRQR